jgi:hypothetical protein
MEDQAPDTKQEELELLREIRDLAKANAAPTAPEAEDISLDDLRTMSPEDVAKMDKRLLNSILESGGQ